MVRHSTSSRSIRVRRPLPALALALVACCALGGTAPAQAKEQPDPKQRAAAALTARLSKAASTARQGVVRIVWQNAKNADDARLRNAIVVSSAGHLLMAGPKPDFQNGNLYAEFADGNTVRASYVASDELTGLTILHVNYRDLVPLRFRPEPLAPTTTQAPSESEGGTRGLPQPAAPDTPKTTPAKPTPSAASMRARPLTTLPLGLPVMMVTGTGAAARGEIRAQDRRIPVFHPQMSGLPTPLGGLVEAGLAAVPSDQGSPWLDEHGNVVALQLATGFAESLPENPRNGAASKLRPRISPSASLAIPASTLRIVTPRLIRRRQVERGSLGITTKRCSESFRQQLADGRGCHIVLELDKDGPAARAGVKVHDVLVRIEGETLRPRARLMDALLPYRPGDVVRLGLLRKGEPLTVELKIARR